MDTLIDTSVFSAVPSAEESTYSDSNRGLVKQPSENEYDDDDLRPAKFSTGLSIYYVENRSAFEAFRENYQNW